MRNETTAFFASTASQSLRRPVLRSLDDNRYANIVFAWAFGRLLGLSPWLLDQKGMLSVWVEP